MQGSYCYSPKFASCTVGALEKLQNAEREGLAVQATPLAKLGQNRALIEALPLLLLRLLDLPRLRLSNQMRPNCFQCAQIYRSPRLFAARTWPGMVEPAGERLKP
jgi:hypothetical protein